MKNITRKKYDIYCVIIRRERVLKSNNKVKCIIEMPYRSLWRQEYIIMWWGMIYNIKFNIIERTILNGEWNMGNEIYNIIDARWSNDLSRIF